MFLFERTPCFHTNTATTTSITIGMVAAYTAQRRNCDFDLHIGFCYYYYVLGVLIIPAIPG